MGSGWKAAAGLRLRPAWETLSQPSSSSSSVIPSGSVNWWSRTSTSGCAAGAAGGGSVGSGGPVMSIVTGLATAAGGAEDMAAGDIIIPAGAGDFIRPAGGGDIIGDMTGEKADAAGMFIIGDIMPPPCIIAAAAVLPGITAGEAIGGLYTGGGLYSSSAAGFESPAQARSLNMDENCCSESAAMSMVLEAAAAASCWLCCSVLRRHGLRLPEVRLVLQPLHHLLRHPEALLHAGGQLRQRRVRHLRHVRHHVLRQLGEVLADRMQLQ